MMNLRPAVKSEADQLAYLINLAGEGIPAVLWSQMAEPGETVQAVGTRRAAREQGNFSYRNARVCVDGDQIAGMIIDYRLDDPYDLGDLAEYPALVQPLVRLEAQVPGRWYVNALATLEAWRGRGVARLLMADAERAAQAAGCDEIALIVAGENTPAWRLYADLGYRTLACLPLVPYPGAVHGGDWELQVKSLR